jgi:16S rRNA (adenine1518-N6/adenine1519-N6)-dimethyltransferase
VAEGDRPARRNPPVLKRFGQHFLTDNTVLQSIADAIAPAPGDTVLEIGPGRGALTDLLIPRAGRIVAVEIDRKLAAQLAERYAGNPKVEIVQSDILETNFRSLVGDDYILVGNVPYYITTPIIFKSLEPPVSRRSVFLVQREVAERIAARAGQSEYGALTVNVAATSEVEIVREVGSAAFSPPPRVDSAVIRLTPRAEPLIERSLVPAFRAFVQAAFASRFSACCDR